MDKTIKNYIKECEIEKEIIKDNYNNYLSSIDCELMFVQNAINIYNNENE